MWNSFLQSALRFINTDSFYSGLDQFLAGIAIENCKSYSTSPTEGPEGIPIAEICESKTI